MLGTMTHHMGQIVIPITDFRKQRALEWLCTPTKDREPKTLKELADEIGVTRRTLTNWKTKDDEFIEEWEKLHRRTVGSPERLQNVLDTLYKTAIDEEDPRHVAAAKEYRAAVEGTRPQKIDVEIKNTDVRDVPSDKLMEILAERAANELSRRQDDDDEVASLS